LFFNRKIFVISKAAGKTNLDAFMTKIQASIKQGEIEEAIATCDKQQGSVAMQLNQR
jgi:biopolymer transport protein ExbB